MYSMLIGVNSDPITTTEFSFITNNKNKGTLVFFPASRATKGSETKPAKKVTHGTEHTNVWRTYYNIGDLQNILLLLLLFASHVSAKVSLKSDRTVLHLNESLNVELIQENTSGGNPDLSVLENLNFNEY